MQLDLSKNSFASKAGRLRSAGRGEQGRRESHLSAWTMGILVNEFASRLIRQPYFSRVSNHSCFGTGAAFPAVSVLAGRQEVPVSLAALMLRGMGPAFKAKSMPNSHRNILSLLLCFRAGGWESLAIESRLMHSGSRCVLRELGDLHKRFQSSANQTHLELVPEACREKAPETDPSLEMPSDFSPWLEFAFYLRKGCLEHGISHSKLR